MDNNLHDTIQIVCTEMGLNNFEKKNKPINKPWFDPDCRELKKLVSKQLNKCKKLNFPLESLSEYHLFKLNYSKCIHEKKLTYKNSLLLQLENSPNTKTFWKIIKGFRHQNSYMEKVSLDTWEEYWRESYPPRMPSDSYKNPNDSNPILNSKITLNEVIISLNKCKLGKAPGSDYIPSSSLNSISIFLIIGSYIYLTYSIK